jgi:hypothetical protein
MGEDGAAADGCRKRGPGGAQPARPAAAGGFFASGPSGADDMMVM